MFQYDSRPIEKILSPQESLDSFCRANPLLKRDFLLNISQVRLAREEGRPGNLRHDYIAQVNPTLYLPQTTVSNAMLIESEKYWLSHGHLWPEGLNPVPYLQTPGISGYMIRLHSEYAQPPFCIIDLSLQYIYDTNDEIVFYFADQGIGLMDQGHYWLLPSTSWSGIEVGKSAFARY